MAFLTLTGGLNVGLLSMVTVGESGGSAFDSFLDLDRRANIITLNVSLHVCTTCDDLLLPFPF